MPGLYQRTPGIASRRAAFGNRQREGRCRGIKFPAHDVLALAPTHLSSACHCAPRLCIRTHVACFCMSLRTSAHTGVAIRVPAENPGNLVLLQANPLLFRIRPKYSLSLCATAGVTDCPVASLLAMTCSNLLPVPIITRALPVCCRKSALAHLPCTTPLQPHPHPRLLYAIAPHALATANT